MVPSCLEPCPGVIKVKEYFLLGRTGQTEEVCPGLVSFHLTELFLDGLFSVSKHWLTQKSQSLPSQKVFVRCQNIIIHRKKIS